MGATDTLKGLRHDAELVFGSCLKAADPEAAIKRFLRVQGDGLYVGQDLRVRLGDYRRVLVVGAGKGSAPMGKALEDLLGKRISTGLICVKYDHGLPLNRIRLMEAAHPVPDEAGEEAARRIVALLESAQEDDLVISCISGGGSALLPAPAGGITLDQKQELTRRLLAVSAGIHEINAVRKHLSLCKGGNLMKAAYPAPVINLMLSDVVGDEPDTIASGPFVPDRSTFGDVVEILTRHGLLEGCPQEIKDRITGGAEGRIPETPKPGDKIFSRAHNVIVGSNSLSLAAGKGRAEELGYRTLILSSSIEGDTTEAASFHTSIAREIRSTGNPITPPACVLSGGETTVNIRGNGLGGRNQEFALAAAAGISGLTKTVVLSAGTDGTDGPTDAAGAVVDASTLERASSLGLDAKAYLSNNDSYHFFKALGDLVITGPTRTNVMDVRVILVG